MWQYLAHMPSVPPDPEHNKCIRFPHGCPLCIHGGSNATIRCLVNGFIYMEKYPPPHGVWTSRLESLPALPVYFHVCEWTHLLVVTPLPSLFGVTHWMGGCDLEGFSSYRCMAPGRADLFTEIQSVRAMDALGLPLNSSSWQGSGKVARLGVMDGCWSLKQPFSPLGQKA